MFRPGMGQQCAFGELHTNGTGGGVMAHRCDDLVSCDWVSQGQCCQQSWPHPQIRVLFALFETWMNDLPVNSSICRRGFMRLCEKTSERDFRSTPPSGFGAR